MLTVTPNSVSVEFKSAFDVDNLGHCTTNDTPHLLHDILLKSKLLTNDYNCSLLAKTYNLVQI